MMCRFIVEVFNEGEFLSEEVVESCLRLLNENDLDVICLGKEKDLLFIRRQNDVSSGYFLAEDLRWDYGTREEALSVIKRRI